MKKCLYFDKKYKCVSFVVHYTTNTLRSSLLIQVLICVYTYISAIQLPWLHVHLTFWHSHCLTHLCSLILDNRCENVTKRCVIITYTFDRQRAANTRDIIHNTIQYKFVLVIKPSDIFYPDHASLKYFIYTYVFIMQLLFWWGAAGRPNGI